MSAILVFMLLSHHSLLPQIALGPPDDPQQTFSRGLRTGSNRSKELVILRAFPPWKPDQRKLWAHRLPKAQPEQPTPQEQEEAAAFVAAGLVALRRDDSWLQDETVDSPFRPPTSFSVSLVPSQNMPTEILSYRMRLPPVTAVSGSDLGLEFHFQGEVSDKLVPEKAMGLAVMADGTAEWRGASGQSLRPAGVGSRLLVSFIPTEGGAALQAHACLQAPEAESDDSKAQKRRRTGDQDNSDPAGSTDLKLADTVALTGV